VSDLARAVADREPRAIARALTIVENARPGVRELMAALATGAARATVVGLTGSPGVGKSTTTSAMLREYRKLGKRVGVIAVDPSSPFSGGALLGDRVRMQEHASDPDVFIRSMASRGHLGGLAAATLQGVRVLEAAGFEIVLIETVGVGQSEVEIASAADTTLVLLAPGMGDAVQAAKAGILEIADVFVVNKADRDGASDTVREIRTMMALAEKRGADDWKPPIVRTVASRGEGIDEVVEAIAKHHVWLAESGELRERRDARAGAEIESIALASLRVRLEALRDGHALTDLASDVASGDIDAFRAADRLLTMLGESSS
jgi:LAO/AO transport system kinase